jgi:excisionase family DNA binding protein
MSLPDRQTPDHPLLLTPEAAARELSLGRTTIYELVATGKLRSVRIGRARRIAFAELERFVAERVEGAGVDD